MSSRADWSEGMYTRTDPFTTYGAAAESFAPWIMGLDVPTRVRNSLLREVSRLLYLVTDGYFPLRDGEPPPPMAVEQRTRFRHDLELWSDPEAVLSLLRSGGASGIANFGKKSRAAAIAAIEQQRVTIHDQPPPVPTDGKAVWDLVIDDIWMRDKLGQDRYGTRLQVANGRDHLIDAYQEALDLVVYIRAEIEKRNVALTAADIETQRSWSQRTFGPGARLKGVLAHIRKELVEVEAKPDDIDEWVDLMVLAVDGAGRQGFTGEQIITAYLSKMQRNYERRWPDWRDSTEDDPIEHIREDSE